MALERQNLRHTSQLADDLPTMLKPPEYDEEKQVSAARVTCRHQMLLLQEMIYVAMGPAKKTTVSCSHLPRQTGFQNQPIHGLYLLRIVRDSRAAIDSESRTNGAENILYTNSFSRAVRRKKTFTGKRKESICSI